MKFSMFACVIFLFIGFKSFADCGSSGLSAFPYQKEIQKTSLFLLDGYANSQYVIKNLGTKFPVYLLSGKEQIPLKVIEIHEGQYQVTQALLKPEKSLTPGKKYQLILENVADGYLDRAKNPEIPKKVLATYLITDESDTETPKWITTPKEKDKSLMPMGCGPSIHVNFNLEVNESDAYLIKTTVKSVETGKETTYYLVEEKGILSIGHGMCTGAFNFKEGNDYQAKFMIMDISGNVSEETEWLAFTKPVD